MVAVIRKSSTHYELYNSMGEACLPFGDLRLKRGVWEAAIMEGFNLPPDMAGDILRLLKVDLLERKSPVDKNSVEGKWRDAYRLWQEKAQIRFEYENKIGAAAADSSKEGKAAQAAAENLHSAMAEWEDDDWNKQ